VLMPVAAYFFCDINGLFRHGQPGPTTPLTSPDAGIVAPTNKFGRAGRQPSVALRAPFGSAAELAFANLTLVPSFLPPGAGRKTTGCVSTNKACWSRAVVRSVDDARQCERRFAKASYRHEALPMRNQDAPLLRRRRAGLVSRLLRFTRGPLRSRCIAAGSVHVRKGAMVRSASFQI
jgi:hypothetical protein